MAGLDGFQNKTLLAVVGLDGFQNKTLLAVVGLDGFLELDLTDRGRARCFLRVVGLGFQN